MKRAALLFFLTAFIAFGSIAQTAKKPVPKKLTTAKTVKVNKKQPDMQKVVTNNIIDSSVKIRIITDSGTMVVRLYDSTPLHRDNFVKLVKEGFYDSLLFHRVISGFMIQGGDPQSKNAPDGKMLGNGGGDMARIPAEFRPSLYHKRGVLAAARDNNPQKASSACQFYIVEGRIYSDDELTSMETADHKFTPDQRLAYKTIGGTPMLDQNYTVFGEVISGIDIIDKIANVQKDAANRPLGNIRMKMETVK